MCSKNWNKDSICHPIGCSFTPSVGKQVVFSYQCSKRFQNISVVLESQCFKLFDDRKLAHVIYVILFIYSQGLPRIE